jgi:hypothetical protein
VKFDCVLINGDSYSAPASFEVYGDHIARVLGLPLINLAVVGSNNDRIMRSSIEFIEGTDFKYPLVIVGWSFIRRLEVWYYGNNQRILDCIPDQNNENHKNLKFVTLNWLIDINEATIEQKALVNEDLFVHKQLVNFYTDLFLFSNYLKTKKIKYFFFSAAKNSEIPIKCFPAVENLHMVQAVTKDTNVYQLHDFYIQDWAQKNDDKCHAVTGHLSAAGHQKFADYLVKQLSL